MDPLSVTASAVAVIQAAGFTATTVYNFVQSIRTADSRISDLCDELYRLQDYLGSVHKTLDECQSLEIAPAQPELWQRCDEALKDCLVTLSLLDTLVNKIKDSAPARNKGIRWRTKVAVDLKIHGNELASFREKVQKSNIALQTMLHTITVSLSLKSNASQEKILFELEKLKYSFKEALRVSSRPTGGNLLRARDDNNPDARVSRNLHNLAAAARQFHSATSSTSGTTIRDGSTTNTPWQSLPPPSLVGDFSEHKRRQVEAFIAAGRYPSPEPAMSRRQILEDTMSQLPSRALNFQSSRAMSFDTVSNVVTTDSAEGKVGEDEHHNGDDDEEEDEAEEEKEYFDGLKDLARDRVVNQDYAKAIEFLGEAMKRGVDLKISDVESAQLQAQLALCHFFQGDWRSAEPIVQSLASQALDEVACNLLHALSLAHLFEYSLDSALRMCRKALRGKKKLREQEQEDNDGPAAESDYADTLALCSMIHHMKGDVIRAEVFHRRLPNGFEYKHPVSELEFIFNHPRLLPMVLDDDIPESCCMDHSESLDVSPMSAIGTGWYGPGIERQDSGRQRNNITNSNSPLRLRFARFERYEVDTNKFVVEGPSPCSPADSGIDVTADNETESVEASSDMGTTGISGSSDEASPSTPEQDTADSPPRLQLRRRVTRMFNARRSRPPVVVDALDGEQTSCPPESSTSPSSRWPYNGARFGLSRPKVLLRGKTTEAALQEASASKVVGRARTMRLGTMELTLKRASQVSCGPKTQNQVQKAKENGGKRPEGNISGDDICYGSSAAGPPKGHSKGRLAGLTTEYYGPDPDIGPYTYGDTYWPNPDCHALSVRHNTTAPHGPDDIVAAAELGNLSSVKRSKTNNGPPWPLTGTIQNSLAGQFGPDNSTKQGVENDKVNLVEVTRCLTQCKEQIPGRLAHALISLPTATDTQEQLILSELKSLLDHVRMCLHDPLLGSDLQRIIASLENEDDPGAASDADSSALTAVVKKEEEGQKQSSTGLDTTETPLGLSCPKDQPEFIPEIQQAASEPPHPIVDNDIGPAPKGGQLVSRPSFVKGDDARFVRKSIDRSDSRDGGGQNRSPGPDSNDSATSAAAATAATAAATTAATTAATAAATVAITAAAAAAATTTTTTPKTWSPWPLRLKQPNLTTPGGGDSDADAAGPSLERAFSFATGDDTRYQWGETRKEGIGEQVDRILKENAERRGDAGLKFDSTIGVREAGVVAV